MPEEGIAGHCWPPLVPPSLRTTPQPPSTGHPPTYNVTPSTPETRSLHIKPPAAGHPVSVRPTPQSTQFPTHPHLFCIFYHFIITLIYINLYLLHLITLLFCHIKLIIKIYRPHRAHIVPYIVTRGGRK